jgi:chaperone required for assembly of F1-ATPase
LSPRLRRTTAVGSASAAAQGNVKASMRDVFEEIFANQPLDPTEAARRGMRTQLRRRFYQRAAVGEDGFLVVLDGRPVRTPARGVLAAPVRALAEALAAEWEAQRDVIDPARMPLTRLANSIIDGVSASQGAVAEEIVAYLGSDLLFYRADAPAGLVRRQAGQWDPILAWARDALGARFMLAEGVMHVAQPAHALAAARRAIPQEPWRLGAVHSITTLTGSALLALAVAHAQISAVEAWSAANVDEEWNMEQWGRDELALERRAFRFAEMEAAERVLALV